MAGMVTSQTFTPLDHLSREVQIDRDEFLRQLPGAIGGRAFSVDGDIITVPEGGGQVRIRLTQLKDKHLGQLDLPMMRIDFDFNGLWDEIKAFMVDYDQRTLRGAGGM